ncbi:MAG: TIGR03936 family radical SAM-associated protein [Dehalococcoidia bacterium]|jgi:radical SAM-linked protein
MQRLRIRFSRGEAIKFISHLDIMRLWQRALHRARIPLAYTEGFSPHPRLSLAAPLAVGITSQAELMDVFCNKWVSPHFFSDAVSQQLPEGIEIKQVFSVAPTLPSLQSQVGFAEYEVELATEKDRTAVKAALSSLLAAEQFPWHHERDTGTRNYDLRALIDDLWLTEWRQGAATIGMRLRCDSGGSGRPEQVAAAMGFSHPTAIRRSQLLLKTA